MEGLKQVAIIGVGLLGGSLGLAIRSAGLAERVVGLARRPETRRIACEIGAADDCTAEISEAVSCADLVVLCTPLGQMKRLAQEMAPFLKPGAWVTDVGSVKASVVRDLEPLMASTGAHFVGGHPMAGSEQNGVENSTVDLFMNAVTILTPTDRTDPGTLEGVRSFWERLQSSVCIMEAQVHDRLVARSSHLPHAVAASLAHCVLQPGQQPDPARLCATGFRDTTRVASGSPEMWRDIVLDNRDELLPALTEYIREITFLRECLAAGDAEAVEGFYSQAKTQRDSWISHSDYGPSSTDSA